MLRKVPRIATEEAAKIIPAINRRGNLKQLQTITISVR
jgi:hypothetical protein